MDYGFWSLIPPIVAIAMALITKQTVVSLIVGLFIGVTITSGWNPIVAIPNMVTDYFIPQIASEWNAGMLMLIISCGGFVYLIKIAGGAKAFGDAAVKKIHTRKQAQLIAYFSAFGFIYTEPTLTLGSIMRPITEKFNISRVKLAYICDVMGCPFAVLSPITSYGVYATGLIAMQFTELGISGNPFNVFIQTLPYNFYALFGMVGLLFVILQTIDIGPMYEAEQRAIKTGKLIGDNDNPMSKYDLDEAAIFKDKQIPLANFIAPLATMLITLFAIIFWSGDVATNGFGGAFLNANIILGITVGFFMGTIMAGLMGVRSKIFKYSDIATHFVKGVELNSQIPVILVLAWSMGALTGNMGLKNYLVDLINGSQFPAAVTPAIIFIVGAFIAFSTGSSWGVWAIMMPIGIAMAQAFAIPYPLMIGAVLSGGVFGDHCSPISDTTILASTAAGADHVEHVRTQLPYALTIGISSVIGFLVGGITLPIIGFFVTALGVLGGLLVLKSMARRHAKIVDI